MRIRIPVDVAVEVRDVASLRGSTFPVDGSLVIQMALAFVLTALGCSAVCNLHQGARSPVASVARHDRFFGR